MVNPVVPFCIVVVSTVSNLKLNKLAKQIHVWYFRNDYSLNMIVLDDAFKLNKPRIKTIKIFAAHGKSCGAILYRRSLDTLMVCSNLTNVV